MSVAILLFLLDTTWVNFWTFEEDVYEEVVCLFYTNVTLPKVPGSTDLIMHSNLLKTPIEFYLSNPCQILELPNGGDHVYLTGFDHLSAYGKTEFEVCFLIAVNGGKPKTATGLELDC